MSRIVIKLDKTDMGNLISGKEVECDLDKIPDNFRGIVIKEDEESRPDISKKENTELRILHNYISNMSKAYRQRNDNASVVHDILLSGTSTAGRTSCIAKCRELGIDPYLHDLEREVNT